MKTYQIDGREHRFYVETHLPGGVIVVYLAANPDSTWELLDRHWFQDALKGTEAYNRIQDEASARAEVQAIRARRKI